MRHEFIFVVPPELLDLDFGQPCEIEVIAFDGEPKLTNISYTLLKHIKDPKELCKQIEYASENNYRNSRFETIEKEIEADRELTATKTITT